MSKTTFSSVPSQY